MRKFLSQIQTNVRSTLDNTGVTHMSTIFGYIIDRDGSKIGEIVTGDDMPPLVKITARRARFSQALEDLNYRIRKSEAIIGSDGIARLVTSDFEYNVDQQCTLCTNIELITQGQYHISVH